MSSVHRHPLVSVIIPCYNQAKFLSDAINSLILQSYDNWECIIVNDGSTDDTYSISQSLVKSDPRVKVVHQNNKGLSEARNSGMRVAGGDFFQFLDADDMLENDKLRMQIEFFHYNPEVDIVFGDARYFTTETPLLRDFGPYAVDNTKAWIPDSWNAEGTLLEKFISRNLFPVNCPLIRRSVFSKVGEWNKNLDALEDWEFWVRCVSKGVNIELLDKPKTFALIRMHSSSMTCDIDLMSNAA